jgi:hypothetical protein
MIAAQQDYVAAMHKAETVTRCYGNQKRARRAAKRRLEATLKARGYSDDDVAVIWKDAFDVFVLERDCDE